MGLRQLLQSMLGKAGSSGSSEELDQVLTTASLMHHAATEPLSPYPGVILQHFASLGNSAPSTAEIFTEVTRLYTQARELARGRGDTATEATVLFNLGRLYQNPPRKTPISTAGRTDDDLFEEMMSRMSKSSSPAGVRSNQQTALSYYREAVGLARTCGSVTTEACCLLNIAVAYRLLGDTRFQQSLREAATRADAVPEGATKTALLAGIRAEFQRLPDRA